MYVNAVYCEPVYMKLMTVILNECYPFIATTGFICKLNEWIYAIIAYFRELRLVRKPLLRWSCNL